MQQHSTIMHHKELLQYNDKLQSNKWDIFWEKEEEDDDNEDKELLVSAENYNIDNGCGLICW